MQCFYEKKHFFEVLGRNKSRLYTLQIAAINFLV